MVTPLHRSLAALTLLTVLGTAAACGGGDDEAADRPTGIAGWREQVRATTTSLVPDLASTIGASTGPADGRYRASSDTAAPRFAYTVKTSLTGSVAPADDVEAALEELGYEVSSRKAPGGAVAITAERGGTRALATVSADDSRPLTLAVTSPFVEVPASQVDAYEARTAPEPLDLAIN